MNSSLVNWKTTVAGIVFGILLAFKTVYQPGMSLKQWAFAAVVAFLGALPGILAHDGFAPKVGSVILLCLVLCSSGFAQSADPVQHFSLSGSVIGYFGPGGSAPASIADGYFNLTQRVALGYQQITIPGVATIKLGAATYSLPLNALAGKTLSKKFVFDSSKINVTFLAGAGKLNQDVLNVDRVAETGGVYVSYPLGANVSLKLIGAQWIHGGIVNGFLATGLPSAPNSSSAAISTGISVHF